MPRLPVGTFGDVQYPTSSSTSSTISGSLTDEEDNDWASPSAGDGWFADNAADNRGVRVMISPDTPGTPALETDTDSSSNSNDTSINYLPQNGDPWAGDQTFTESLRFYDATTWPVSGRATTMPSGCGTMLTKTKIGKGKKARVYGTVNSTSSGSKVYLQQHLASRWKTLASTKIAKVKLPNGKRTVGYVFTVVGKTKGKFMYRVCKPSTTGYVAAYSPTKTLKVRR